MIFNKLLWAIKRHPFLYLTRFKLLSKNSSIKDIEDHTYNANNPKSEIPKYFRDVNTQIFEKVKPYKDLDTVIQIGTWLKGSTKGGPGLSVPSEIALKTMLEGKGGVCSDRVQIFNNFCTLNDIKVREWGSTRAPFNKAYGGHSFNEVFCKELNKWVLIDVSYCVMFYVGNDAPLSVVEFYQMSREGKEITYKPFGQPLGVEAAGVAKNYLNAHTVPFLVCNYSNKLYDTYLKLFRPYLPVFMIHFMIYIQGKSYYYRFPLDDYRKIFN